MDFPTGRVLGDMFKCSSFLFYTGFKIKSVQSSPTSCSLGIIHEAHFSLKRLRHLSASAGLAAVIQGGGIAMLREECLALWHRLCSAEMRPWLAQGHTKRNMWQGWELNPGLLNPNPVSQPQDYSCKVTFRKVTCSSNGCCFANWGIAFATSYNTTELLFDPNLQGTRKKIIRQDALYLMKKTNKLQCSLHFQFASTCPNYSILKRLLSYHRTSYLIVPY